MTKQHTRSYNVGNHLLQCHIATTATGEDLCRRHVTSSLASLHSPVRSLQIPLRHSAALLYTIRLVVGEMFLTRDRYILSILPRFQRNVDVFDRVVCSDEHLQYSVNIGNNSHVPRVGLYIRSSLLFNSSAYNVVSRMFDWSHPLLFISA